MKATIETSIKIHAPANRVIEILKDTKSYPLWNPFIKKVDGKFIAGETIRVTISSPGGPEMKFKPKVLIANDREIRWKGKFLIKGLFDGEHYFILHELSDEETMLIHGEHFEGVLVLLFKGLLSKTKIGFQDMNQALKKEIERVRQN